jgi:hypothetical protein
MIWCESRWVVCGPKFIVPRQMRLTRRPLRPRWLYSMSFPLSGVKDKALCHSVIYRPPSMRRLRCPIPMAP